MVTATAVALLATGASVCLTLHLLIKVTQKRSEINMLKRRIETLEGLLFAGGPKNV